MCASCYFGEKEYYGDMLTAYKAPGGQIVTSSKKLVVCVLIALNRFLY